MPVKYKANVLLMQFLGEGGWSYPTLKSTVKTVAVGSSLWRGWFLELIVIVKRLFHCAELVHADLSEYNVLIVKNISKNSDERTMPIGRNRAVIIDLATGVQKDHERALEFLTNDLSNLRGEQP